MYKIYDSHIHFNMKADDIINDFKHQVECLDGFILILNTEEEKALFENELIIMYKDMFPLSVIALNYELADEKFIAKISALDIKYGIKLHPRLSNITLDKFENLVVTIEKIDFHFIIVDCFYYGSNLDTHTNLELSIYVAKYFKDKNILLAHGGGHKLLEYMLYTRELKNIYYDLSLSSNYLKNTSIKQDMINFIKFNKKRVFFGSDYPDFTVLNAIESYNELFIDTKTKKEDIYFNNIMLFLDFKGVNYNER